MPLLNSITEPKREVFFDVEDHTYTDQITGKILTSGTTWCKQFKEPFDAQSIAAKCSRDYGWGVPASDIEAMWSANGNMAAGFGTAIHEALEYWTNFKAIGAKIKKNTRKDKNPAYPKHPLLYRIIKEFDTVDAYPDTKVVPEAFVSFRNFCGQLDRLVILDESKKIARIGDYKINAGATARGEQKYLKQFAELPETKMSGYQMQMSFYAHLMTKCGWTIAGLDVYVFDSRWKHYVLPVLDLSTGRERG